MQDYPETTLEELKAKFNLTAGQVRYAVRHLRGKGYSLSNGRLLDLADRRKELERIVAQQPDITNSELGKQLGISAGQAYSVRRRCRKSVSRAETLKLYSQEPALDDIREKVFAIIGENPGISSFELGKLIGTSEYIANNVRNKLGVPSLFSQEYGAHWEFIKSLVKKDLASCKTAEEFRQRFRDNGRLQKCIERIHSARESGQRITQMELCKELGVSRHVITKAAELEKIGNSDNGTVWLLDAEESEFSAIETPSNVHEWDEEYHEQMRLGGHVGVYLPENEWKRYRELYAMRVQGFHLTHDGTYRENPRVSTDGLRRYDESKLFSSGLQGRKS